MQPLGVSHDFSLLTDFDLHLFNEGAHSHLYQKMGAHPTERNSTRGVNFAVWAPDAEAVHVMGNFNGWSQTRHRLHPRGSSGIWEGFIAGLEENAAYKYFIQSRYHGYRVDKADPFGFWHEVPPRTASIVRRLDYEWGDQQWMQI